MSRYFRQAFFLVIAILIAGVGATVFLAPAVTDLDQEDLAGRVQRARLDWADYGEGIKAALGATPAALWDGMPTSARLVDGGVEVTFALREPWRDFDFGMPILLRDPEGKVYTPQRYVQSNEGGVYTFGHTGEVTPLSLPWVELRFPPNEESRIVFDTAGRWRATLH